MIKGLHNYLEKYIQFVYNTGWMTLNLKVLVRKLLKTASFQSLGGFVTHLLLTENPPLQNFCCGIPRTLGTYLNRDCIFRF